MLGGRVLYEPYEVYLYVWPGRRRMDVLSTLLHELVHLRLGPGFGHGSRFRWTLRAAVQQAYGIGVPWASYRMMGRYVQWGLAEMANRGFWESVADVQAGR